MGAAKPSYEELEARLAEAQSALKAIGNENIDALVGRKGVYLLRLNEMEKALEESEEKFRKAFENAAVGFALTTPDGRFVEANSAFCRITGYALEDLKSFDLYRLLHPDDSAENRALIDQLLAGHIPDFVTENRYIGKDGKLVWVRKSASLVRSQEGAQQWIIILIEDISDRKRAEASLAQSLARIEEGEFTLNTLMETVPEGITIADAAGIRILQVSRYGKELLGKTSAELENITVEQHAKNWDIYEQDGQTAAKNENLPLTRAVQKGDIVKDEEWVLGKADGSRIPILCNAAPILDKSSHIIGGVIAWKDITARKQLEEALRENNQELTEYAYALTHNIKAPLRAISNYVNFLFEDLADTLEGDPKKFLEGIRASVAKSNKQFADLEALYGIKNHTLNPEAFPMQELLDEIQFLFKDTPNGQIIAQENWPVLKGERLLLRQILINLIGNGLKYNRADIKRVEIGWQQAPENRIEIFVRDNGIGIAPQYQEQIFHIFKRLHTDSEYEGTGIGLAIAKRAAQKISGKLRVESAAGKGSTFYINLPNTIVD